MPVGWFWWFSEVLSGEDRLLEWILRQHKVTSRSVTAETEWNAIADRYGIGTISGAGDFVPEPTLAAGTISGGLHHDRPSLELPIGVVHLLDDARAHRVRFVPVSKRCIHFRV